MKIREKSKRKNHGEGEISLCQWRLQKGSLDLGELGPFFIGRDPLFMQVMSNR